ncbi:hypothetical protein [Nostoc flagelliforme]|uniref:hypothetical protein n=1 Tax=Nostoc flagelliforme TaxID=1306274 RepID=UPI0012FDCBF6|nr:hypothetical protein [Nostoc flagelliforme]
MAHRFNVSTYYVTPEHLEKMREFSGSSGHSLQDLVNQFTRGHTTNHRPYYEHLARLDVTKRGMDVDEWVDIVINEGFKALPAYKEQPTSDEIGQNPLGHIILPSDVITQDGNYMYLTKQNLILVKTANYFDGSSIAKFISRIIFDHLNSRWEKNYARQMQAEKSNDWLKIRS